MDFEKYKNTKPYGSWKTPEGRIYREEEGRLMALFKSDLFDDLGIKDNPKREMLYIKAWDRGHSDGLYAVYN